MEPLDIDEIAAIDYPEDAAGASETATITFKDGSTRTYSGAEHPEVFALLNHWTPPTA